jgi:hypothetical protein
MEECNTNIASRGVSTVKNGLNLIHEPVFANNSARATAVIWPAKNGARSNGGPNQRI